MPYEIYSIFVGGESTQPRRDGNRNLQLPRGLECPICFQILQDPSFVKIQGVTKSTFYNRRCLDECFRRERKDPMTGIQIADNEPIRECRRMKYLVSTIAGRLSPRLSPRNNNNNNNLFAPFCTKKNYKLN